jgi:hypothetical protein
VIARKTSEPLASLAKQIDQAIADNPKLKGFVVLINEDEAAGATTLKELAEAQKIENVPLTLFNEAAGPNAYQISKEAEVTVMMWRGSRVQVNRAFGFGKFTADDAKAVAAAIPDFLKD